MRDSYQQSFRGSPHRRPTEQSMRSMQSQNNYDFNQSTRSSRRLNNSSRYGNAMHNSGVHNSTFVDHRIDDISEMTGTIAGTLNDTTQALRSSVNDNSTLDTVTLRSNVQWSQGAEKQAIIADARRRGILSSSNNSNSADDYHLGTDTGIDFCADYDKNDPLSVHHLDTTSLHSGRPSKRKRRIKMCCGCIVLILLLGAIAVTVLYITGVIGLDDILFWQKLNMSPPVQNMTSNNTSTGNTTNIASEDGMVLQEILGRVTLQPSSSNYPTVLPSLAPSYRQVVDILDIPPEDLEGKCSASNFPYAVDICRESCVVAECCYLNQDSKMNWCFDMSGTSYNGRLNSHRCSLYRPYCDVFFDTWDGAEDGYIRPPPENLNQLCGVDEGGDKTNRGLSFEDDVCLEACLPSKCCQAMEVAGESDIESIIGYLGYVETSCQYRNEEACQAYNETCFGIFDRAPPPDPVSFSSSSPSIKSSSSPSESVFVTSSPTMTSTITLTSKPSTNPSITEAVTIKPSIHPSFRPSLSQVTTQPTRVPSIPLAKLAEISNACTSPTSKNLIESGNLEAKLMCLGVCEPGICCYADILISSGLTDSSGNVANLESCFDSNKEVCEGYSGCLALALPPSATGTQEQSGQPELPTQDLTVLCSTESRSTPEGVINCFDECRKGSCCTAMPPDSCFDDYQEICGQYGPCQAMLDASGGDAAGLPPKPPGNLHLLCSYDSLLAMKNTNATSECEGACSSIGCCLLDECSDGQEYDGLPVEDTPSGRCELYDPCKSLYLEEKMEEALSLCQESSSPESVECLSACNVAYCCFPQPGDESCFTLFEDLCVRFAPFCAPAESLSSEGSAGMGEVAPPPENLLTLCLTGYGDDGACEDACSPSDCCFATSQSCFAGNEDVCAEWVVCASRVQPQEEQEDFGE